MKFSCDRCQMRYSIGDDKVKGKVLKIRCKSCGSIIVVREQQAASEAAPAASVGAAVAASAGGGSAPSSSSSSPSSPVSSSSPPAPASSGEIDWFMAVKGKQRGPAKFDEVARLFREGQLTERTHLWHDKMSSWTRLKDLPEFASVVAEGQGPRRTLPPPPPPTEETGAEIVNFEAARAQRHATSPPMPAGLAPAGLAQSGLAQAGQAPAGQAPAGQAQSGLAQAGQAPAGQVPAGLATSLGSVTNDPFAALTGGDTGGGANDAPRESTRVFIMQAGLHNRAKKQRMYAGVAAAVFVGFIGLCVADYHLDILGLKRVVEAVAEKTGIIEEPIKNNWDDVEADPVLKCKLNPDPAECVKKETAAQEARRARRAAAKKPNLLAGGSLSDEDLKKGFENGVGSETDIVRRIGDAAGGIDVNAPKMSSDQIKAMFASGKGGPSGPKTQSDAPSVAGASIDAENAGKVVREGQAGIQACVESAMKLGEDIPAKIHVTLSIQTNGIVDKAIVNEAVVNASKLGSCVTSTARKWKFAPTPEAADLVVPLLLK